VKTRSYIALGANLGDSQQTVEAAIEALAKLKASKFQAVSSLYCSKPLGLFNQPDFINAVAAVDTELAPLEMLFELFKIEAIFGRQREIKNAPRTLDLDLLLHGDCRMDTSDLTLPHPRMHLRAFVLLPLQEIAPEITIPGLGKLPPLLAGCLDQEIGKL